VWAGWPFAFGSAPGAYAGALVLLCIPAALRSRARRYVALALLAVGVGAYVLMLNVLVGAGWFRRLALDLPFGDVYLHNPGRLRYVAFLVLPALGALGLQSFLERPPSRREAAWWIGGAIAVFVVVPVALGARPIRYLLLAVGLAATAPVLLALFRSRAWARAALVGVLTAELLGGAIWSSVYNGGVVFLGLEGHDPATSRIPDDANIAPQPLRYPKVPVGRYLTPGPIARTIASQRSTGGRYLAWIPPAAYFNKGYLWTQQPTDWPALLLGRAVVFRIDDALGYSPIQLPRYWSYIRATDDLPVFYNASVIQLPSMQDVWLLGIRYLVEANGVEPTLPGTDVPAVPGHEVASERGYRMFEVDRWEPRVSVVPDWSVASSGLQALDAVLSGGFDPAKRAVVEGQPAAAPTPGAGGSATYTERWPEDVRIDVRANADSIVVVRNAWDRGWTATVDGKPAPLLRTDYFLQGVEVPAGRHVVRLTYRDPTIGEGIVGSAAAWTALAMVTLAAAVRRRRRRATAEAPAPAS
jgi:hypothetical protein